MKQRKFKAALTDMRYFTRANFLRSLVNKKFFGLI